MSAVVIGVGNPYRRDDGVGPAVVERLRERVPADVRLEESEGEPSHLLELWTDADLAIVVDAVRTADGRPGRIHRRRVDRAEPAGRSASTHRADLGDAIALASAVDRLPGTLVLYGIEVVDTSYGAGLTPPVETAAGEVAGAILARLKDASGGRDVSA
jgi:hydrogenase maturation protease